MTGEFEMCNLLAGSGSYVAIGTQVRREEQEDKTTRMSVCPGGLDVALPDQGGGLD